MPVDLNALAAEVAAVLDLDADVLSVERTVYEGEYRINLYRNCLHVFRAGFGPHYNWNLHVLVGMDQHGQAIEEGYRIEYEGQAHPEALALLSAVWAHVNGQGGEPNIPRGPSNLLIRGSSPLPMPKDVESQ